MKKERLHELLEAVNAEGFLSTEQAAKRFHASEATIRRDFKILAAGAFALRIHGGLRKLEDQTPEVPLELREEWNSEEKRLLAAAAAAKIQPGDSVMLYGGSTAEYLADLLPEETTVVTNFPGFPLMLHHRFPNGGAPRVILTGGEFSRSAILLGAAAQRSIERYFCKFGIASAYGADEEGLNEIDDECSTMMNAMMRHSEYRIVLLDHTKFQRRGIARSLRWEEISLVITTRCSANHQLLQRIREKGTEVLILPPQAETSGNKIKGSVPLLERLSGIREER